MPAPARTDAPDGIRSTGDRQPGGRIDVESIKAQLDIVALARTFPGTNLKQRGTVYRGGCPCCGASSKKEPFQVDPRPGEHQGPHFHCFSCGENGDVFNLFALQHYGTTHIAKTQFIATVRAAAQTYGFAIPETGLSGRASPEQLLRAEIQTAWACAHEYVREQFLRRSGQAPGTDPHAVRQQPLGAAARLGIFADGLSEHLTHLGLSDEARRRAQLSPDDLAAFSPGIVLLRTASGMPAGFSQQTPSRAWIHRAPAGTRFEPAFVSARPSGRPQHRVLILVPDLDRAGRLAANLVALARSDEEQARRIATVGIVAAPDDDPLDCDAVGRITKRAMVLVPAPDTSTRAIFERGVRFLAAGIAVRVADAIPQAAGIAPPDNRLADARVALDTWEDADDFLTWQAKQISTPDKIEAWYTKRIPALLAIIPDDQMRDVLAHRAAEVRRDMLEHTGPTRVTNVPTARVSDTNVSARRAPRPSPDHPRGSLATAISSAHHLVTHEGGHDASEDDPRPRRLLQSGQS